MQTNILITNSAGGKTAPLSGFFKKLEQNNCKLFLLSVPSGLFDFFKQSGWGRKKAAFGPMPRGSFKTALFFSVLPFLSVFYFFYLSYCKYKKSISSIICLGCNDKIVIAPAACLIGLKILWFESPSADYNLLPKSIAAVYKFFSKRAAIIVFDNISRTRLQLLGISDSQIFLIPPGIELNQHKFQNTIFSELAQATAGAKRKYFTIGTAVDLNSQQNLKSLFGAVKICISVIPDIQLVVIGDGEKRKDLIWLAKKMEIDSYIWFVGKQSHLRKWLDNFDIYAAASEKPNLTDIKICLRAMAASLPVIGVSNLGLEDLIDAGEGKAGLLTDNGNNEELAQSIIKLQQNERMREEMGRIAKERVEKYFTIDKMVSDFKNLWI